MKQSKHTLTLVLMISSLVLLGALQFFWLRSSYEKAYSDFRRESTMVLRSTLFGLRDSLFVKGIEPVKQDSNKVFTSGFPAPDSAMLSLQSTDTLINNIRIRDRSSKVQIFISSTERVDSSGDFLKPLASTVHGWKGKGQQSFFIRMGPDTLNRDTLTIHYSKDLSQAGIYLPFFIQHSSVHDLRIRRFGISDELEDPEKPERLSPYSDTLITDRVHMNPLHSYAAVFPGMYSAVLKEIAPQIFFSVFLTFMVALSFIVMYRNIRSQQKLMELKNDFISNVTHELKTPVATVSVALEALKDFHALNDPARTREYLDIAQSELNRLTLMTDKILKASVFENNGVTFIPEKINLDTIVRQVLSSMKLLFEKRKLRVEYKPEGSDFELEGSGIHLTNVIYNLVDNALKYSAENTSIDISLKNRESNLLLSIRDEGIGIKKEYQKKIFEKFFRVPTGDVHNVKGYGLGLNYVAGVVRSHSGTIHVNSDPGKGSCFTITLPGKHV